MNISGQCMATPEEHEELRRDFARGDVELAIAREVARQFYLVTPAREIRERTGQLQLAAKLTVYAGVALCLALALTGLLLFIYYHQWWSAVAIPIAGILWTVIAGLLNPVGPAWTISLALALSLLLYPARLLADDTALPFLLWLSSLWVNRMTYIAAERFLVRLVVTSQPAFESLCDHIVVRRREASEG